MRVSAVCLKGRIMEGERICEGTGKFDLKWNTVNPYTVNLLFFFFYTRCTEELRALFSIVTIFARTSDCWIKVGTSDGDRRRDIVIYSIIFFPSILKFISISNNW